jgi:hypothetical protein
LLGEPPALGEAEGAGLLGCALGEVCPDGPTDGLGSGECEGCTPWLLPVAAEALADEPGPPGAGGTTPGGGITGGGVGPGGTASADSGPPCSAR